ncbi:hypothetical protein ACHAWX_003535 [Stephanocyclus meneghinianus]
MERSLTLLGICFAVASSFQPAAFITTYHRHDCTTLAGEKAGEESDLSKLWDEEKLVERDIIVQETINGNKEDVVRHIVTEMLETALEHVKILEKEKAKHAKEANLRFDHAVEQERVLQEFIEDFKLGDDAPIVDDYIRSRLHEAEQEELDAMNEEDEYVQEYQDLRDKEKDIKDLLEQIKNLEP